MPYRLIQLVAMAILAGVLAGCSSFGMGVTKAIIAKAEEKPKPETSLCEITGPAFAGLDASLETATSGAPETTRLIVVHGIGEQTLGYSERFQRNLALRMGLDNVDPLTKTIALVAPPDATSTAPGIDLGGLRLSRYANTTGAELLVFELTWSDILEVERKALAFDNFGTSAETRADLNRSLKRMVNSFADPLAYNGAKGSLIQASMLQALCWVGRGAWADYPGTTRASCSWQDAKRNVIQNDDILISTHSLGSRIALDSMEALGTLRDSLSPEVKGGAGGQALDSMRDKDVTLFMLANQLPLLQMGKGAPAIVKQTSAYCGPGGAKIRERWFKNFSIVAFSDPNDILSYTIPQSFAADFMDSRLCANTTNVVLAVAQAVSLGVTSLASPQIAHSGYDSDERVLTLMTQGLMEHRPPTGCSWLRTGAAN